MSFSLLTFGAGALLVIAGAVLLVAGKRRKTAGICLAVGIVLVVVPPALILLSPM